jgi:ribose transport system substrate-binding protein
MAAGVGALLALFAAGCTTATSNAAGGSSVKKHTYTVYLSNNFLGNDFRVQMIKTAQVAAQVAPLKGRIDLRVENSDNSVEAQIASLNSIILNKPDAIILDPGSPTGLNSVIQRACSQGITVIAFDQGATAPCAYNIQINWAAASELGASWMAKTLHGKGSIFEDTGLAGASVSAQITGGFQAVLAKNPGIHVAGTYQGQYAQGPEQQGISSLLASHPAINGILTQGYCTGGMKALKSAGRSMVPMYCQAYNGTLVACVQQKVPCIITANPPWIAAQAEKIAVGILDGKKPAAKQITLASPCFVTNSVQPDGASCQKVVLGQNAYPSLSPGAALPISPPWADIAPGQVG